MPHLMPPTLQRRPMQRPGLVPPLPNPLQPPDQDPNAMPPQGMPPGMTPGMAPPGGPPQGMQPPPGAQPPGGPPPGGPQEQPEPDAATDPAVLKALVERGLLDEDTAMALLDQKQGFQETQIPSPEGTRTPGPFGTYVAANPLEHAAAGMRRYQGYKKMKAGSAKQEALRRRKEQDDTAVQDWILR